MDYYSGTCLEGNLYRKTTLNSLNKQLYPQSAYMCYCDLCCLKKDVISYSKNIFDVKKGEAKKVQVTERLKSVKSLWGQEEKVYQQGCVEIQHTKQVKYRVSTLFFKIHN